MGIARQVLQNLLGSPEGRLGIDHPFTASEPIKPRQKPPTLPEGPDLPMEAETALLEGLFQVGHEFAPEQAAEDLDRKEESLASGDPTRAVARNSTAGNHTVEMRMRVKVLSPGMEHRLKADLCAQTLGIGGKLQERFGRRAEHDAINHALVLEG